MKRALFIIEVINGVKRPYRKKKDLKKVKD